MERRTLEIRDELVRLMQELITLDPHAAMIVDAAWRTASGAERERERATA